MGKWWSVLFGVMMAASGLLYAVAPFVPGEGWWLPQGVSTHAHRIDGLYYVILGITGFFFILTEALLVYFMWVYAGGPGRSPHVFGHHAMQEKGAFWTSALKSAFRPVSALLHDQHRVEMAWTVVPAAILLYIALVQINTWAEVKYQSRMPGIDKNHIPVQVEVSARQFEWRMRYPSPKRWKDWTGPDKAKFEKDAKSFATREQPTDIHLVNELHVFTSKDAREKEPKDVPATVVYLKTIDVLHSFNVPQMRIKQDSLPGRTIPVWFRPIKANTKKSGDTWVDGYNPDTQEFGDRSQVWEIACAELCGWGHYRMIGRVYVHESEADFLEWLESAAKKANSTKREGEST